MEFIKKNLKPILIIALIFAGLIVSLILIKNPTIFKSKAAADIDYPGALNITDSYNQPLKYKGEGVYITKKDKVKLGIKDFQKLVENKQLNLDEDLQIRSTTYNPQPFTQVEYCYLPFGAPENCQREEDINNTKEKALPPISTIPPVCQSIDPSPLMKISQSLPFWANWLAEHAEPGLLTRILPGNITYASVWLPFKWDQSGSIPKTQGDEDPRWVIRAIRIITALQGDNSYNQTDAIKYWNKKEGYDLDKACKEVISLKEEKLLQGVWLPSDDQLEKIGQSILGQ